MTTFPATAAIRSTQVRLFLEQCPAALTLYDEDRDDRAIYATGVAGHDVLHGIGLFADKDPEEVAQVVVKRLISTGRHGIDAEGPLEPDAAFAGRDIVLRWIHQIGGDPHPHPHAHYEAGLGFRVEGGVWHLTKYGEGGSHFKIRPDVVYPLHLSGEEGWGVGIVTRDYKTSWAARAETLDTIQLRAQAVAVWHARKHFIRMEPDFIRREVVNLRSGAVYTADTWMDGAGRATIDRWGKDILTTIAAINEGNREPRVGAHCLKCPYVAHCDARKDAANDPLDDDLETLAREYVLAEAWRKDLQKRLRKATQEAPIDVGDDTIVGFIGKPTRTPADDVHKLVWDEWSGDLELDGAAHSTARGMLRAMHVGKTQLEHLAKAVIPDGDDKKSRRAAWVDKMTKPVIARKFGIWPKQ